MNKLINTSNEYLMTVLVSLSVWIVAIIINAVADIILMGFASNADRLWTAVGLIVMFSAMFSLPGIIIFWFVFLFNCKKEDLFNMLFITACLTSFLAAFIFFIWVGEGFGGQSHWLLLFAVLSALASVVLHRPAINDVLQKQKNKQLCTGSL